MFRSLFIPLRKNTTLGALSLLSLRENYCSDLWIKNCQYRFGARLLWAFKKIIVQTFGMNCHFEALSLLGSRDDYCPHLWEDLQLWSMSTQSLHEDYMYRYLNHHFGTLSLHENHWFQPLGTLKWLWEFHCANNFMSATFQALHAPVK